MRTLLNSCEQIRICTPLVPIACTRGIKGTAPARHAQVRSHSPHKCTGAHKELPRGSAPHQGTQHIGKHSRAPCEENLADTHRWHSLSCAALGHAGTPVTPLQSAYSRTSLHAALFLQLCTVPCAAPSAALHSALPPPAAGSAQPTLTSQRPALSPVGPARPPLQRSTLVTCRTRLALWPPLLLISQPRSPHAVLPPPAPAPPAPLRSRGALPRDFCLNHSASCAVVIRVC